MKTSTIANDDSLYFGPRADAPGDPGGDVAAFAATIRAELDPGALETLLAERIIRAAGRLQSSESGRSSDIKALRYEALADRAFFRALDAFHALRGRRGPRWGKAASSTSAPVPDDESVELPALLGFSDWSDDSDRDDPDRPGDPDADRWEDRLTIDPEISETSPVVRETWITVRHVISLIVDGESWAEILRGHPELTEADIRACLAYAIEEEGGILQF